MKKKRSIKEKLSLWFSRLSSQRLCIKRCLPYHRHGFLAIPVKFLLASTVKKKTNIGKGRVAIGRTMTMMALMMVVAMMMMMVADASDTNHVYDPCSDAKIQKSDGFTFGVAFSTKESFFFNQTQLSPCDRRLSLSTMNAQLAIFRPKVDEISLLTINGSTFSPNTNSGYIVAFAGRKYAARSPPALVADNTHIITSFTLVLEFQKGILQNLFWKTDGCTSCSGKSSFVCLNHQDCAVEISNCNSKGGTVDCSLGIQLAFSGSDKNDDVLNSWYEVKNLRQYSLYGLYSNLKGSVTGQYDKLL